MDQYILIIIRVFARVTGTKNISNKAFNTKNQSAPLILICRGININFAKSKKHYINLPLYPVH